MLKSFVFLIRFLLFWIVFFLLDRIVFLAYFPDKLQGAGVLDFLSALIHGIRLDASMAAYLSGIPLLIFIVLWLFPKIKISPSVPRTYVGVLIVLFSFISIVNFNIYREWGTKINFRALDFAFNSTEEAVASSSSSPVLSSFAIFFVLILVSFYLSGKIIDYKMPVAKVAWPLKLAAGLLFLGLNFLLIRGNWGTSPINQSMSYFSTRPFLNHAAVNTEWNLIQDLLNNKFGNKNPYRYYPEKEAQAIVNELYTPASGSSPHILTTRRPNVVFIIIESYTADVIESLGGEKGIAPNMEKLIPEGLLFKNIYASGDRTDKGLIAVLSAFPAQATRSIMKLNDKQERLPALAQVLAKNGYHTSFYYGGESEFFNLKSYVISHSYQKLVDKHDFPAKSMSSWGAFDHYVFKKNADDLNNSPQPFFSTLLTLSNHEPFQLPEPSRFPGESTENKFRSTAYYTDQSLGNYIQSVRNNPWYKNTLFVIVADHGHRLPKNLYENFHPGRFRIPLLFFGDALKPEYRGKSIDKIGSQTDIAATLLSQLGLKNDSFPWSHDLLNANTPEFSFFNWDNGFGFATKDQIISFDNVGKNVIYRRDSTNLSHDARLLRYGKAYMQKVFQSYLNY